MDQVGRYRVDIHFRRVDTKRTRRMVECEKLCLGCNEDWSSKQCPRLWCLGQPPRLQKNCKERSWHEWPLSFYLHSWVVNVPVHWARLTEGRTLPHQHSHSPSTIIWAWTHTHSKSAVPKHAPGINLYSTSLLVNEGLYAKAIHSLIFPKHSQQIPIGAFLSQSFPKTLVSRTWLESIYKTIYFGKN